MPYVSARYAPPSPMMPDPPEGSKPVIATDDQGLEWHLTEDSQVGDWLAYVEGGGIIDPAPSGSNTNQNITSAPDTLFGGPTIAQVLGETG